MYRPRHPLVFPLAFLALAGSVGVGYIAVQARVDTADSVEPIAAPVVCCDGLEGEEDPHYANEAQVFYRGEEVL